ncbi:hypothetical protein [Nonomuraea turcica]|uniref:hypothetical protein n=1 Tax=Nonomuraea sp. G32 TaxID=3067274 RepID=UPI00273ACD72|nr:hypothetical protein [Nonomuraea sp. G32]MDP4510328.1 hypothetical protein [Nonomuraea sp. G32]
MSDPPVVKLPPDGAGYLLKRRTLADGREEALVAWTEITPGPRGGLVPREDWLPLERVHFLPNVDYGAVELTQDVIPKLPAGQADASHSPIKQHVEREYGGDMYLPPEWPPEVHSPSEPEWELSAVAWLLDTVPPEYRAYEVLKRHPIALARMALLNVNAAVEGARAAYRHAAGDLRSLSPDAVEAVLAVYREEGLRLVRLARSIEVVSPALHGEMFTATLRGNGRSTPPSI